MADSRCFVQLSHPGREHERDHGPHKAWNRMDFGHARKFMQLHGQWIEKDGSRQTGDLHAWGEWEAESELVSTLNPPAGDWLHPRYLWRPYYVPKDSYEGLHNTDPFIFGQRFLYSNCSQPSRPGLRALDTGSVIAFGSGRKPDGEWRWMRRGAVDPKAVRPADPNGVCPAPNEVRPDGRSTSALPGSDTRRSRRRNVQLLSCKSRRW